MTTEHIINLKDNKCLCGKSFVNCCTINFVRNLDKKESKSFVWCEICKIQFNANYSVNGNTI